MSQTPPEGPDDGTEALPAGQPHVADPRDQATEASPAQQPAADSAATQVFSAQDYAAQGSRGPGGHVGAAPDGRPLGGQPYGGRPGQPYGGQPYGGQPSYGQPLHDGQPPFDQEPGRRNTWLVPALIGLALVVLVATAVFLLTRGGAEDPVASPTPTLPQSAEPTGAPQEPTEDADADAAEPADQPTGEDDRVISADPLEPRLDATVTDTDFALTEAGWSAHPAAVSAGAREALAGTYSDGSLDVPVTAAAFDSLEGQDAYSDQLVAALDEAGATLMADGPVYPDETGHYWAYLLADGVTTSVVWRTDDGVVLSLTGDSAAVPEIYSNMLI